MPSSTKDTETTIESLKTSLKAFCEARDWDQFHSPKELAIGMSTEAAELLELFRFKTETQMKTILDSAEIREKISHELADVFFFVLRFSQLHGFDLTTALLEKMDHNARKYPVETARGSNLKYTELAAQR